MQSVAVVVIGLIAFVHHVVVTPFRIPAYGYQWSQKSQHLKKKSQAFHLELADWAKKRQCQFRRPAALLVGS
jgi:hypothetical protein